MWARIMSKLPKDASRSDAYYTLVITLLMAILGLIYYQTDHIIRLGERTSITETMVAQLYEMRRMDFTELKLIRADIDELEVKARLREQNDVRIEEVLRDLKRHHLPQNDSNLEPNRLILFPRRQVLLA